MTCCTDEQGALEVERAIEINLPDFHELKRYHTDFILIGVGLSKKRFKMIKKTLPLAIQERVIGWRRIYR